MQIIHSDKVKPVPPWPEIEALLKTISETQLREWVEHLAVPRHYLAEPEQNRAIGDWLFRRFESMGYRVSRQGQYSNILAMPEDVGTEVILVGAHYDSVPSSPGADDNASAVAAMLGCADMCSHWQSALPVMFVAFNREEDNLMGSRDFVEEYLPMSGLNIRCVHILEMVGFASSAPGSQCVPTGLPISMSDIGNFLGLLANRHSSTEMKHILSHAGAYVPDLPVTGLNVKLGIERFFPVLARSDHAHFWLQNIPAVMWTDTSEFRNPHYHQISDTPDTLNYGFLRQVTQLLTAAIIHQTIL